jgi:hypothetical protein
MSDTEDILQQLRAWASTICSIRGDATPGRKSQMVRAAADEIERLRAERDEARRHCCEYAAIVAKADTVKAMETGRFHEVKIKHMRDMGWDCFKEDK